MKKIFISLFCSLLLLGGTFSVAQALTALAPSDGSVSYGDLYRQLEALQQQINEWQWKQNMGRSILPTPPTNSTPTPPIVNTNIVPSNALGTAMNVLDKSALILIAPDGNDSKPGSSLLIRWSAVGFTSGIKTISVYKGTTLVDTITRDVPATVTTYNWTIPSNFAIGDYRIELKDNTTGTKSALDEGLFRVNPTPTVLSTPTLTVVPAKYGVKVSWGAVTGANKYKVTQYLYNGQTVYEGSATSFTDGELDCNKTYKYTIRALGINGASSPESSHYSATTLSCTTADPIVKSLTLISPDDNIEYKAGSGANVYIRWISSGLTGTLTANLYKGGTLLKQIHTTLPIAQRSYNWTLPQDLTTGNYRIELKDNTTGMTSSGDEGLFSVSSGVSPITPPVIKVLSPNGREKYKIGDVVSVKWEAKNLPSQANNKVFLSIARYENGGPVMDMSIENGVANTGSYAWKIKNDIKPGLYTFRVMPFCSGNNQQTECSLYDDSNGTFEITANTYTGTPVKITYPNGKEKLEIGKTYTIKWTAKSFKSTADVQLGIIDTRYSSEGGNRSEKTIANIKNTGSYKWTVPSNIETLDFTDTSDPVYRIKLYVGNQEINDFDASDNTFSIVDKRADNVRASLSSGSPKAQKISLGATNVGFLDFVLSNSDKTQDYEITGITVNGVLHSTDLSKIYVYDGTTKIGELIPDTSLSGVRSDIMFSAPLIVSKGNKKIISLKADVATFSGNVGKNISLSLEAVYVKLENKTSKIEVKNVMGKKMTIVSGGGVTDGVTQNPKIAISSPKGGEKFLIGGKMNIDWNMALLTYPPSGLTSMVMLKDTSTNLTVCKFADVAFPSHTFSWNISTATCSPLKVGKYKVVVALSGTHVSALGESGEFEIVSSTPTTPTATLIKITSPKLSDSFSLGSPISIKWDVSGTLPGTGVVQQIFLMDGGATRNYCSIGTVPVSSINEKTWNISTDMCPGITPGEYRIYIVWSGSDTGGVSAQSEKFFVTKEIFTGQPFGAPTNLKFVKYSTSDGHYMTELEFSDNSTEEDGFLVYYGDGTVWAQAGANKEGWGTRTAMLGDIDCEKPMNITIKAFKGTPYSNYQVSASSNTITLTKPTACANSGYTFKMNPSSVSVIAPSSMYTANWGNSILSVTTKELANCAYLSDWKITPGEADNRNIGAMFLSNVSPCSKKVGLQVKGGTKAGVYDFTVSAKHGTLNPSAKVTLTVSPPASASFLESVQAQLEQLKQELLKLQ